MPRSDKFTGPLLLKARVAFVPVPGMQACNETELASISQYSWLPSNTKSDTQFLLEKMFRTRSSEDTLWNFFSQKCTDWDQLKICLQNAQIAKHFAPTEPSAGPIQIYLRTNSVASKLYHEKAIEKRVAGFLATQGFIIVKPTESQAAEFSEQFVTLVVGFFKDTMNLSWSLSGRRMGRRQYKSALGFQAPLREEQAASCCLQSWGQSQNLGTNHHVLVPFAGSGTLGFESILWLLDANITSPFIESTGQKFIYWTEKTWGFFKSKQTKQLIERLNQTQIQVTFVERSEDTSKVLTENILSFLAALNPLSNNELKEALEKSVTFKVICGDFFTLSSEALTPKGSTNTRIWMPLNPPFGLRLGTNSANTPKSERLEDSENGAQLYERIGSKIDEVFKSVTNVQGFILCPHSNHWQKFEKGLKNSSVQSKASYTTKTSHFMQGGLDMRLLSFGKSEKGS
jgi:23S rRNA G2445 N2-methylase RlmL